MSVFIRSVPAVYVHGQSRCGVGPEASRLRQTRIKASGASNSLESVGI